LSERGDHGRRVPAGDLEKHHKAGMTLDERAGPRRSMDVRAWYRAVCLDLARRPALSDRHSIR